MSQEIIKRLQARVEKLEQQVSQLEKKVEQLTKPPVMLLKPRRVEYNIPKRREGSVERTQTKSSTSR